MKNIVVCLTTLILFFLCLELFIRLNPHLYATGYIPSKNDKIVYELRPNSTIKSLEAKINSQGLNDRYFVINKPKNMYRMAVIGNSTSFGWMVGPEKSFPKVLESMLRERRGDFFEVINFFVPGYNTAQELEVLKERVLRFKPNMVILAYCGNDTYICNFIEPDITILNFLYIKSYAVHFLLRRIDLLIHGKSEMQFVKRWVLQGWLWFKNKILGMFYYDQIIYPQPGLEETIYVGRNPPHLKEMVPKKYWYMLGLENHKVYLSNICTLFKERKIEFIICGFLNREEIKMFKELGIENICDASELLWKREINFEDIILPGDGHLNIQGHFLFAEHLYGYIDSILK